MKCKESENPPFFFCLNESSSDTHLSQEEKGAFVTRQKIIIDKNHITLSLSSSDQSDVHTFSSHHSFCKSAVPFLKSLLQKSIRRKLTNHAIFACYALLELDHIVLFRRLCIIMIEDVVLHEGFSTLVWHMIAKQPPTDLCVRWTLGLVKYLCEESKFIDHPIKNDARYTYTKSEIQSLPRDAVVWSLLFRRAYGGLRGDINMIDSVVQRLINGNLGIEKQPIFPFDHKSVTKPVEWMYEAIDFHVHPLILHLKEYPEAELRKMMWCNSSGVNLRKKILTYRLEDWKKIAHKIRRLQIDYFEKLNVNVSHPSSQAT